MAVGGLNSVLGRTFFACTMVFQVLAIVAVGLRVWSKHILRRNWLLHDWLCFAALFFSIGFSIDTLLSVTIGGVGLHVPEVMTEMGPQTLVVALKIFFASIFLWITATTLVKLSILDLYVKLFRGPIFRAAAYTIAAITTLFWLGYILMAFLFCRPLAFNWDKTIADGTCGNVLNQMIGSATINMILDFAIVILPMPVLWTLQLPTKKKVLLSGILSLGLAICAMNITRVVLEATTDVTDFTFSLTYAGLFAELETHIGIIVACLPTLGPLLKQDKLSYSARQAAAYTPNGRSAASRYKTPMKNSALSGATAVGTFDRLDDDVPLKPVEPYERGMNGTSTMIKSNNEYSSQSPGDRMLGSGINVETNMQVHRGR